MAADAVSDDLNYEIWAPIVKATLVEKGLWDIVVNGVPPDPSKIPELASTIRAEELSKWRDLARKDMEALQLLQSSLTDSAFRKTLSASSAKDVWDLLANGNELQCGEQGHYRRDCKRKRENQQPAATEAQKYQAGEVESDYEMFAVTSGDFTYDEGMWMIHTTATNHMTPHGKFFTTLDRTHRARIKLANGSIIMAQGRGDVKIMTNEGKKMIKNVLFVPGINRNVLSVVQMTSIGYTVRMTGAKKLKLTIEDQNGSLFGESMWDERGFFLRFRAEEVEADHEMLARTLGDFTYDEDMWMIYTTATNHMTPYVKFFVHLDRTHKARVKLANGSFIMAEGRGHVKIMFKERQKMIKDVLFVPEINRNVLSVSQMTSLGCTVIMAGDNKLKFTIEHQGGRIFGKSMCDKRGFFLR